MLQDPSYKYNSFPKVALPDRSWPERTITKPPIWLSTDLRDGNQALFEPMNVEKKLRLFELLCQIGFKEIEVAFPSASQTDFDFVRLLIEQNRIPKDVTISILTQARPNLIERSFESIQGIRGRVIVHMYTATAPIFRDVVFRMSKTELIQMVETSVSQIRSLSEKMIKTPTTEVFLEYSPEAFSATELTFAQEICHVAMDAWEAKPNRPIILNLPATVEMSTPNIYADQIEWMGRNIKDRNSVIISIHPHNDRGCAVAAAELGMLAGADRVEGCLFGNGERTGNVDLATLALNLYTKGIDPKLDFSDINQVARTVEYCTQLPIHPRHPYVGDLVFTAFSGSHQDAINKGFKAQESNKFWDVPYLPIDPADLGRNYDSVIRINSQSGKGGIAYLMEAEYGIRLPRRLQVEFSGIIQKYTDQYECEITAIQVWQLFSQNYLELTTPITYQDYELFDPKIENPKMISPENSKKQGIRLKILVNNQQKVIEGKGNGPIDATMQALLSADISAQIRSYEERSIKGTSQGCEAKACAFVEVLLGNKECYGVGLDNNIITASIKAIFSGINRGISLSSII